MDFLKAASGLGDLAVVSAVALVAIIVLLRAGERRGALALVVALLGAACAIGTLKVAAIGCSHGYFGPRLNSPSGHAAMSASVLGTLGVVLARQLEGWARLLPPLAAVALIGLIAATRVILDVHTVEEVLVGLATGAASAGVAILVLLRAPSRPVRVGILLLAIVFTAALTDGLRSPAEELVRYLAGMLRTNVAYCAAAVDAHPREPHGFRDYDVVV